MFYISIVLGVVGGIIKYMYAIFITKQSHTLLRLEPRAWEVWTERVGGWLGKGRGGGRGAKLYISFIFNLLIAEFGLISKHLRNTVNALIVTLYLLRERCQS